MKANAGKADRAVRILAGFGLISLIFFGPQTMWGLVRLCASHRQDRL
jgi:hypothetical protein